MATSNYGYSPLWLLPVVATSHYVTQTFPFIATFSFYSRKTRNAVSETTTPHVQRAITTFVQFTIIIIEAHPSPIGNARFRLAADLKFVKQFGRGVGTLTPEDSQSGEVNGEQGET